MSDQRLHTNIRHCSMTNQRDGYGGTIDEESSLLTHQDHLAPRSFRINEGDIGQQNAMSHLDLTYNHNSDTDNQASYVAFLLATLSMAIFAERHHWHPNGVFAVNLTAISLLTVVLEFSTKQLSLNLSDALGNLVYAVIGNTAELIIGIVALRKGQFEVVQFVMLGSILASLLFSMGMCFFIGNILNMRNGWDTQVSSSASLFLPTALNSALYRAEYGEVQRIIVFVSRGISIILLLLYTLYLILNLRTHYNIFSVDVSHYDEVAEGPIIALLSALTLLLSTFILIPIMSNATGNVTAVLMTIRNKMDLAIRITTGSSIQIAFFVTPSLVIIAWAADKPLDLRIGFYQGLVYALSTLVVITSLTKRGTSNYLKGAMSLGMYTVISLAAVLNLPSDEQEKLLSEDPS
ncbi:calcium/proton exchanger [Colletotrichum cuscutae]|uniref:Calcium/proton exchanger n=1 Tax=Colletotrichum cuscutae TaxID=1209917 RepID=A0AAI9YBC9_9PEZI|nr:calcium/proton exchanger [Colletotrichum cuscutae]